MKKEQRLSKTNDFQRLYRRGSRVRLSYFVLHGLATANTIHRLGIVVSRKIGNAVQRNRLKRRLRNFYERLTALLPIPSDVIIIATQTTAAQLPYRALEEELCQGLQRLSERLQ